MNDFMRNTDAFAFGMEEDARLRSTIVSVVVLDRSPDWDVLVDRFERVSRLMPMFRQRVVSSLPPAPPRWVLDPDFDLRYHLTRVRAPAPGTLDTLNELDAVAYRVERAVNELGDAVPVHDKARAELLVGQARDAVSNQADVGTARELISELQQLQSALSASAASAATAGTGQGSSPQPGASTDAEDDDIVDAEFDRG